MVKKTILHTGRDRSLYSSGGQRIDGTRPNCRTFSR